MTDLFLLKSSLREAIRPKRLIGTLLLVALPALIGLLWRLVTPSADFEPAEAYNTLAPLLVFGFLLTLLSVIYGTGAVTQEMEQRTIVYLLTRPVPRWRILLMKYLGVLIAISAAAWVSILLLAVVLYGPAGLGRSPLATDLRILPLGAAAYAGLFLLLATIMTRPLIAGLLFVFGWESWVPSLPGAFGKISLMAYLRILAPHRASGPEAANSPLQFFSQIVAPAEGVSRTMAWSVLGIVAAVGLIASLVLFSVREYVPKEDSD